MSTDEVIDRRAHDRLLRRIAKLGSAATTGGAQAWTGNRFTTDQTGVGDSDVVSSGVDVNELIATIHSTKNVNDLKKQLNVAGKRNRVLHAPVHRQQRDRIHRSTAYEQSKRDADKWEHIVEQNRLADQLSFPLYREPFLVKTAAQLTENFTPRTAFEIETAEMLKKSKKSNLPNNEVYTEAEKEIIRSMSLMEAKAKCAEMQRMRALMSYREAKFRRQKKIKSKRYHRLLKRQKRKQLVKEFENLLEKDPEAARDKLDDLERDRVLERATLKHRGGSKWSKQLTLHASRDPQAKQQLQEHLRFGRQLAEKHGMESDDSNDNDQLRSVRNNATKNRHTEAERLQALADELDNDADNDNDLFSAPNPWLKSSLSKMRREKTARMQGTAVSEPDFAGSVEMDRLGKNVSVSVNCSNVSAEDKSDPDDPATVVTDGVSATVSGEKKDETSSTVAPHTDGMPVIQPPDLVSEEKNKKKRKRKSGSKSARDSAEANVDSIFESLDNRLLSITQKELSASKKPKRKKEKRQSTLEEEEGSSSKPKLVERPLIAEQLDRRQTWEEVSTTAATDTIDPMVPTSGTSSSTKSTIGSARAAVGDSAKDIDSINVDPKQFLKMDTRPMVQIASELVEGSDGEQESDSQQALLAGAFEDDDVIADFKAEKTAIEEAQKPKDIDLSLPGWGDWVGPGIEVNKQKKKRFIIPAPKQVRKDSKLAGVIINEKPDESIKKMQVTMPPFPFTNVDDWEATCRQPIGREWNPDTVHRSLTEPVLITQRGAIIKPMDKAKTFTKRTADIFQKLDL